MAEHEEARRLDEIKARADGLVGYLDDDREDVMLLLALIAKYEKAINEAILASLADRHVDAEKILAAALSASTYKREQ